MSPITRNLVIWASIALVALFLFNLNKTRLAEGSFAELSYSQFYQMVSEDRIASVRIENNQISGKVQDGSSFSLYAPDDVRLLPLLGEHNVEVVVAPPGENISLLGIFFQWLPMILLIVLSYYIFRQMQGSGGGRGGGVLGFGKSRAQLVGENDIKINFNDVAGVEEAKEELEEIVDFLKNSEKYLRIGAKIPKGVLLIGSPGTGKTLLARAVAGEAHVPFFTISGSDFVEMFVGVGASRVRDLFDQAKKSSPCIVFIDEIDAVGRHRGAGLGGGNDEREQTLNQLLVEMDGFEATENVILMAATNRPDVLDPALLRPGRFDRQVIIPSPDIKGREAILQIHLRKVPQDKMVDPLVVARGTPGFSGADLANLVNEAALLAAKENRRFILQADLENAKDKVMLGTERRSMVMSEEEKRLTAVHESGHALASVHLAASDPIHKVTIIPRGRALGMVLRLPERDQLSMSKDKLEANMIVAMGGRIAEEMIFGAEKVTTGAAEDIRMATSLARKMVTEWGMSNTLGPIRFSENQEEVFLGHSVARQQSISEETAAKVDEEIKLIIEDSEKKCRKILVKYKKDLLKITEALLQRETLSGKDVQDILEGKKLKDLDIPSKKGSSNAGSAAKRKRSKLPNSAKGKPQAAF